jgi:thiol-disulfide isomerase/thioredoxin
MKLLYFMLSIFFSTCSFKKPDDTIIVKGVVKNILAKKVYLTDAYNWQAFLDSADYKNDTFSFHIKPDNFEPFMASICYIDGKGKRELLTYQNYILATSENKYAHTAFVLDWGITFISGTMYEHQTIKTDKLKIIGSKQNDPFFKTQLMDFGWISTKDKAKRPKIINIYKSLIKQYPYSFYFLKMLYNYRTLYTKPELVEMLALFNNEARHFSYNRKFFNYFEEMTSLGTPLNNFTLKNSLNQYEKIIDNSANLNMIIFWASWCGPCRREIPKLKKIYNEFENKGIHMVSVSLDNNKEMWKTALLQEDMHWKQLIIDSLLSEKVKNSYNFSAIPLIIFSDSSGLEIARFTGYEPNDKDEYTPIIEKYLKKPQD